MKSPGTARGRLLVAALGLILPLGCGDRDGVVADRRPTHTPTELRPRDEAAPPEIAQGIRHMPPGPDSQDKAVLSKDDAIRIARTAIGELELQKGAPIEVTLHEGRYVVVFVELSPPHTPGPGFAAKVTIDASSGKVLEGLSGPD